MVLLENVLNMSVYSLINCEFRAGAGGRPAGWGPVLLSPLRCTKNLTPKYTKCRTSPPRIMPLKCPTPLWKLTSR